MNSPRFWRRHGKRSLTICSLGRRGSIHCGQHWRSWIRRRCHDPCRLSSRSPRPLRGRAAGAGRGDKRRDRIARTGRRDHRSTRSITMRACSSNRLARRQQLRQSGCCGITFATAHSFGSPPRQLRRGSAVWAKCRSSSAQPPSRPGPSGCGTSPPHRAGGRCARQNNRAAPAANLPAPASGATRHNS
jgi:hypothetical protein